MEHWLKLVLVTAAAAVMFAYRKQQNSIIVKKDLLSSYDYIIIGGGTTGAVIANRLSEDKDIIVLLLEAGKAECPQAAVPLHVGGLQKSEYDWKYQTEPSNLCCFGMKNRQGNWPRGKVLGGSSMMNYMAYIRGSPHDYDAWQEQGAEGWSYKDVLPYFMKSENNLNERYVQSGYHGNGGPLFVSDVNVTSIQKVFIKAGVEMGLPEQDLNGKSQMGIMHSQNTVDGRGHRSSATEAFIRPIMHRSNLHIATECHVTKIIFKNKIAVGVAFLRDGLKHTIKVNKEVILSAGAIASPHILMLSGIGPKRELGNLNIPIISDLPVGENLQDHTCPDAGVFLTDKEISIMESRAGTFRESIKYQLTGRGMLSTSGIEGHGFLRSKLQAQDDRYPYLQLCLFSSIIGSGPESHRLFKTTFNTVDDVHSTLHDNMIGQDGFVVLPILLHPWSRGKITLRSKDPLQHPVINANTLGHPNDLKVLVEGMQIVKKMEETDAFKSVEAKLSRRIHPLCKDFVWGSDDYWSCFVKSNPYTLHHQSGTCKMGSQDDNSTVVDPQLRVKGVRRLRVADASIMPIVTSGNTNAACVMIGEKAADMIKEARKLHHSEKEML